LHAPSAWHYGPIADYWALVNLDAPELDFYEQYLRSPVLDAGCGAGRLLYRWLTSQLGRSRGIVLGRSRLPRPGIRRAIAGPSLLKQLALGPLRSQRAGDK
jgi:hypothetical protein